MASEKVSPCFNRTPSSCITYTGGIPFCISSQRECIITLDDYLNATGEVLCQLVSDTDLIDVNTACLGVPKPSPFVVNTAIQQLYDELCLAKGKIETLENKLTNVLDLSIDQTDLDLKCLPANPCAPGGTYSTLKDLIQGLIDKVCSCCPDGGGA